MVPRAGQCGPSLDAAITPLGAPPKDEAAPLFRNCMGPTKLKENEKLEAGGGSRPGRASPRSIQLL